MAGAGSMQATADMAKIRPESSHDARAISAMGSKPGRADLKKIREQGPASFLPSI